MVKNRIGKKWIAVYTKPRHEKTVALELGKKGIESYLPLLKERRKWSDRKKWVEFPLFRSYVFVKIELKNVISLLLDSFKFLISNIIILLSLVDEDKLHSVRINFNEIGPLFLKKGFFDINLD